jgi:PAS domain S-box-containing protein
MMTHLGLLESIPDALLIVDSERVVIYVNSELLKLFGYMSEELIGHPLEQLIPARSRAAHQSHVDGYAKKPYVRPMSRSSDLYALHKDGREFPVQIYLSPYVFNDKTCFMAAVRDMTRQKQLEAELMKSRDELELRVRQRTGELEETARRLQMEMKEHADSEASILKLQAELSHVARLGMIGEMASGLGHELNQPLAAITNYAQGCIRHLYAGTGGKENLIDALQRITRESSRASEIIGRFRRFSRKEDLQREWVSADTLIIDAVRLTELESSRQGVGVDLRFSGLLPQVHVDPIQIQQVVVNLVRNAVEATVAGPDADKSVVVHVSRPDEAHVKISVTDRGHGLLAESVEQLFQPFFTTKAGGLGMGLSLSRRIIEAHGGSLQAEPGAGIGMVFYFELPISYISSHD